jgi:hypothetical protein
MSLNVLPPNTTATNITQVGGTSVVTGGVNGSLGVGGLAAAGAALSGNPVLIGGSDGTDARAIVTDALGNQMTLPPGLQNAPIAFFDQTVNQAGVTQKGLFFPTTIAITGGLPAVGSGSVATLTNSTNVCGAVFSPKITWDSVLLDIIGVGGASTNTVTLEIGRLNASGAVPTVLASAIIAGSATTLGATTTNPLTGLGGHSSVTWRFFDAVTLTTQCNLGEVLVGVGGTTGGGPMQLRLACHDVSYYYVCITALNAAWTELLSVITPIS